MPNLSGLKNPVAYHKVGKPVDKDIIEFVEDAFKYWQKNPTKWRTVTLASEKDREEVESEARRFVTEERQPPLTFQVKGSGTEGPKLTYRVRDSLKRS